MENKKIVLLMVIALSIITLAACAKDSKKNQDSVSKTEQNQQVKDSVYKADNTGKTASTNDTKVNKNVQVINTTNTVTKIEGRRKEFIGRLDSIQKELDALPEKKNSDAGVTIAMRSYYGKSYDMYDKALNEIYTLLKKQLSPKIMKNLQTKQIKWIKQKEAAADKEAAQYEGGTFEFVAYNLSLYESTKERCYELVNEYMTD
ncbi:DUF1311 domain-containing protein [Clostridium bovifaecis]|uniref:DUF1311 domain-containing protein n=1 Tax=Clostridium bovifaecis TaxID=2184719 RepID=A0A6I6EL28_9CLOT|nr:DUF1311 domain-containing protein [Clostridium bovifaecis]